MPRYPQDGQLVAEYEVHCAECQQAVLGLGRTKAGAEKELIKHYEWKKVCGYWTCFPCLQSAA